MLREKKPNAFKTGIDTDAARQKRADELIKLRKDNTDQQLARRRKFMDAELQSETSEGKKEEFNVNEELEKLPYYRECLLSDNPEQQIEGAVALRKILSVARNPPITEVVNAGVVPRFVSMLSWPNPRLQLEAAWALTNVASGDTNHTRAVVDEGAIPAFVDLLSSDQEEVREQAVWALGNIAGDSPIYRNQVLQYGGMTILLSMCASSVRMSLLRNITWAISNLCRGKPQPNFDLVKDSLKKLPHLLLINDNEVKADACWALSYLSDDVAVEGEAPNQKIRAVLESGVTATLVSLLSHPSNLIKTPALRTIGNLVTGDHKQTQIVLNHKVLPPLAQLLTSPRRSIRKEACWTISNITAGSRPQIEMVAKANIFHLLVETLRSQQEYDVQKEAAWAICNACSGGTREHIRQLVSLSVVPALCALLLKDDPRITLVVLEGLRMILTVGEDDCRADGSNDNQIVTFMESCGGATALERLFSSPNSEVAQKAIEIAQEFFETTEEQGTGPTPVVDESTGRYNFGGNGNTGGEEYSFN